MKISHLSYQDKFAGIKIVGETPVSVPTGEAKKAHMQRAFYLMAQLEAPVWGTIQSYDGCAMSAGPAHWIAVMPKTMDQGPLFALLRRLELNTGTLVKPLWDELKLNGLYVARDGKLRDIKTGSLTSGKNIRNLFTPPNGLVPKVGTDRAKAEKWAVLFYQLVSNPKTFPAQIDHSIEYLVKSAADTEMAAYKLFLPTLASPERIGMDQGMILPEAVDLAMCVYHAFTPNAPAVAKQCLEATLKKVGPKPDPTTFAKILIKALGTKSYGRWKDVPGSTGSRYDWTRNACIKSKLWSDDLLSATMPQDF